VEHSSHPLKILLVDLSRVSQKIASGLLGKRGHEVVTSSDLSESLGRLAQHEFDVLLIELQTPGLDPEETKLRIQQQDRNGGHKTRVVGMTTGEDETWRDRCHEMGMHGFIIKPFRPDELYRVIEGADAGVEGSSSDIDILDWQAAVDQMQGREDMLKELAETFVTECESLMTEVSEALSAQDLTRLRRAAHTMKGSANIFCAAAAAEAARKIELMARDRELENVDEAWAELQSEVARLMPALEDRSR
jgi:CheY-like chemotaxis protein